MKSDGWSSRSLLQFFAELLAAPNLGRAAENGEEEDAAAWRPLILIVNTQLYLRRAVSTISLSVFGCH